MCIFSVINNRRKEIDRLHTLKDCGWRRGELFYLKDSSYGQPVTIRRVA